MDIRGIEVTNQLRSAIRAKLLELGVRYDEELPDYILVMVVNKKSRQQMHEDLYLFLEDNTAPFVDWLHDQVLKKLQKVTVAKKKATREFVPSVIVKQEEERKNRKTATSFLEDHTPTEEFNKLFRKTLKEDKEVEKETLTKLKLAHEPAEAFQNNLSQSSRESELTDHSRKTTHCPNELQSFDVMKAIKPLEQSSNPTHLLSKSNSYEPELKCNPDLDKSVTYRKRSKNTEQQDDFCNRDCKKLKSSICKPKITSVVSIKNRLGIISPRKNFQSQHNRANFDNRPKHGEPHQFEDSTHRNNISRSKNLTINDNLRSGQGIKIKGRGAKSAIDIKQRLGSARDDRSNTNLEAPQKIKRKETLVHTIKNRLGSSTKIQKQSTVKMLEINKDRRIESRKLEREQTNFKGKNVKYRLGPLRKKFRATNNTTTVNFSMQNSKVENDSDSLNLLTRDDLEDEDHSVVNMAPVKSHVVAVQKLLPEKTNRKKLQSNEKEFSDAEDKECKDCQVSSKVIVTPRPLKPLQPTQKRATQSLLLRAVAEANQSVVKQKNPEPSLVEMVMLSTKLSNFSGSWGADQNLSVHLDAKKRFVSEKIQIELTTVKTDDIKSYCPHEVTDEDIGVVRSLFQKSNNNQKFLVTLNGYSNSVLVDESSEDNQESLETEVHACKELEPSTNNSDACQQNESDSTILHISNTEEDDCSGDDVSNNSKQSKNVEKQNTEIVDSIVRPLPSGSRKLSPIIYNRSRSPTSGLSTTKFPTISAENSADENFPVEYMTAVLIEGSTKRCRYWPNCTSGITCAYYHPSVPCSVFPVCKFGKHCPYLHPACKFGLSCVKIGCIFSHPSKACKYHPFCTKLACSYFHPSMKITPQTSGSRERAKFTWRKGN